MSLYVFLKLLGHAALPPASMVLGIAAGAILFIMGLRRLGKFVAAIAVVQVILLSLAPVANSLMAPLQEEARAEANAAAACCYEAIVVLGGSIVAAQPPRIPEPELVSGSDRLWKAARLFHQGAAPRIIVTGGNYVPDGEIEITESATMRLFLRDLGVPGEAIIEEDKAQNTLENIAFVRKLVGDKPIALVTSAYHMPRALRIARRSGMKVAAFPNEWRYVGGGVPWDDYLPSLTALAISGAAIWEYMALAFDGRMGPQLQ